METVVTKEEMPLVFKPIFNLAKLNFSSNREVFYINLLQ